jgi:Flp pilus assembly protein TadD
MLDEFQRDEALIHFQRGLVLERANRVQEAVEEYRRAIARYPHLREAHDALGFYYQRYGLLAKAAEEFRVVANLEGDFLSHFNLGYVLLELNRYDEALEAFQYCLKIERDDPATHYEVGLIRFVRGEYQAALEELRVPLQSYPKDWEVHSLIGRCHLRIGNYDEALIAFGKALRLALRPSAQAEVIEHICTVERYREIGAPRWAKDRLYADYGVVYLGSAQDDGIKLQEAQDYHFTYPDIGVSLRRFLALVNGCDWYFTCVVALDRLARPLSDALAYMLDVPQRYADDVDEADVPLLVLAVGREAELMDLALERIPSESVTFCLGLNWLRHSATLPDISAIIARGACSVPWEPELRRLRSDGAPPEQIEACLQRATEQILAALDAVPSDDNLSRQIRYYAREHQRVRFADVFDGISSVVGI